MKSKIQAGLSVLIFATALLGCATAPSPSPSSPSSTSSPAPTTAPPQRIVVTGESVDQFLRNLRPRENQPVFLGVATRLRNRDEEEVMAILHAAEQASRYVRMAARYQVVSQTSGRSLGVQDGITAEWDANLADRLVESVTVLQILQDNEGTYILATVDGIPPLPAISVDPSSEAEPEWVTRPPRIPGFIVTTGVSLKSRRFRDSIDSADQEALKEILSQTSSSVRMLEDRREVDRQGTSMSTTVAQEAAATLRQFLVIARHASADGRYYYSLVIAREE